MPGLTDSVPVQIHLTTAIDQEDQHDDFVFDIEGQLVQMGKTLYLRYIEETVEQGRVPVTIKIMPNGDIKLTRSGQNRLQLNFRRGHRLSAQYKTPYGLMNIDTVTPLLNVKIAERPLRGELKIDYLLYGGDQLLGKYNIRLQFTI